MLTFPQLMSLPQQTRTSLARRGRCAVVVKTRRPQAEPGSAAVAPAAITRRLCPTSGLALVHRAPADAPVAGWPPQSQFALQSSSISEWILSLELLRNVLCTTFNANLPEHECER